MKENVKESLKEIKWGTPASLACLGVFLAGLGIFFNAVWTNFLK